MALVRWRFRQLGRTTPARHPRGAAPPARRHLRFTVLERAYDRTLDALESVSNRIGVLIAVQAAIEAVLIDNIHEFGRAPGLLGFAVIVATALQLRASGGADFIAGDDFRDAFNLHPQATRHTLMARIANAITTNEQIARRRRNLLTLAIAGTIATIAWATATHLARVRVMTPMHRSETPLIHSVVNRKHKPQDSF